MNHLDWLLNSGSGFQHRHTVSIQGGNDKLSYNLSLGYMGQDGITAKTNNTRYTGLFTMKSVLTEGLTFNMSLNAYANNYKAPNSSERDINGIIGFQFVKDQYMQEENLTVLLVIKTITAQKLGWRANRFIRV